MPCHAEPIISMQLPCTVLCTYCCVLTVDTLDSRQVGNTQAARQCTMQVLPQANCYLKEVSTDLVFVC